MYLNNNSKFLKIYKNKKVLVTGTTGFKGSWLCLWLLMLGAKVIGVSLKADKNSKLYNSLKLKNKIKQYNINLKNFSKLNKVVSREKPDIIFHLAAQSIVSEGYKNPLITFNSNILGGLNILECVRINKIKNLVFITSDKCYLNVEKNSGYKETDRLGGHDNYSSSKASAEIIFKSYKESYFKKNFFLQHVTARAGNVIGGGDFKINRIVPDIIRSIINNKNIFLRNPNATRPWQHVLEPLFGYLLLGSKLIKKELKNKKIYPHFNFGPNKNNCKKVYEIVQIINKIWGGNRKKIILKKKSFYESTLLSLDIQKAKKELNWYPVLKLEESLKLTVEWYKNFFFMKEDVKNFTENQIKNYIYKIK